MRTIQSDIQCQLIEPSRAVPNIEQDVRQNLFSQPRSLSPKYFYDAHGSDLFTRICDTPEYYPTRTEERLLRDYSDQIIAKSRPQQIIELGSGNAQKTRNLFDACESLNHHCDYAPFDVCEEILIECSEQLQQEYPWLSVQPLLGDFHAGLDNLPEQRNKNLYLFLGGSIGNFTPEQASNFIKEIYQTANDGDYFLLGADRVKSNDVLHAAYNDAEGITAAFNLNILNVLNKELAANFILSDFEHAAHFNQSLQRIEMYLVSKKQQLVEFVDLKETITFEKGEKILTEISCKYDYATLEKLLEKTGFSIIEHYQPENNYFSLVLLKK